MLTVSKLIKMLMLIWTL